MTRTLAPGTRVSLKSLPGIVSALHGAIGTVRDTDHVHSDELQWMQFDEPISNYSHGKMRGCWFKLEQVTVLSLALALLLALGCASTPDPCPYDPGCFEQVSR